MSAVSRSGTCEKDVAVEQRRSERAADAPWDVVIVDDHDDTREVAAEVLRLQGFAVRDFARAEDALEAMALEPPRAAVIDLTLGAMSGEDLARALRARGAAPGSALIVMTGHTSAKANEERLWDCVLIKPVDPFELARTLRSVVEAREAS